MPRERGRPVAAGIGQHALHSVLLGETRKSAGFSAFEEHENFDFAMLGGFDACQRVHRDFNRHFAGGAGACDVALELGEEQRRILAEARLVRPASDLACVVILRKRSAIVGDESPAARAQA